MLGNLYQEEIWQMPELYDFVRQAAIPGISEESQIEGWMGMDQIVGWYNDGRTAGIITRLVEIATRQNKFAPLVKEVEEGLKKQPEWNAGKALLAILRLKEGKQDEARKTLEAMLANKKDPMPFTARWIIGQELEPYASVQDLAIKFYESTVDSDGDEYYLDYNSHPVRRLVNVLQQQGHNEEARNVLLRYVRKKDTGNPGYDAAYLAYRKLMGLTGVASAMIALGYPADAMQMYREAMSDTAAIQMASRYYGGNEDYFNQQIQGGLQQAFRGLKPEVLGDTLRALFKPSAGTKEGGVALDLGLIVQPRDVNRAAITSLLVTTLKKAANNAELVKEMNASLQALVAKTPQDPNVHVIAALVALIAKDAKGDQLALVQKLVALMDNAPLETLPEGTRANARQRAEAAKQMGYWLVAVECLKNAELRTLGEKLAGRALEAANRQTDKGFALAMLREWGQIDHDRGDVKSAEARWSRMLEIILFNPNQGKRTADATRAAPPTIAVPAARP
jgi:hypothetical protein